MPNYTQFEGQFACHTCKEEVRVARLYFETSDLTWMCEKRHLSKVTLIQRRGKK